MIKLKNIKNILFDCDGVLYQDLEAVFGQVSEKMTEYISKKLNLDLKVAKELQRSCLLYTSPSPRDRTRSRMPSSA